MKAGFPVWGQYVKPPGADKLRANLARTVTRENAIKIRDHIKEQIEKAKEKVKAANAAKMASLEREIGVIDESIAKIQKMK